MKQTYIKLILSAWALLTVAGAMAAHHPTEEHIEELADTIIQVDGVQVSAVKQGMLLRSEPVAASILDSRTSARRQVAALKDLTTLVPNLHIPDYGSRMTSSIYVRGLGARIDQPAIGMNVDNVPVMNKNNFDTELADIARIEVLRGPQSTLYGRNTMGGVVNVYTLSPFDYQGMRLVGEYSSGNSYRLRTSLYEKLSDKWAFSLSAYTTQSDGFFENGYTHKKCDWEEQYGGRWKTQYRNGKGLRIENTFSAGQSEQGGYPYRFVGGRFESEQIPAGVISYNDPCGYERLSINDGLTLQYEQERYSLTSITSYQFSDDDMRMDNDFLPLDYFTLQQKIREQVLTEDIVFRSRGERRYNYLFGLYGFYRYANISAPVNFKIDGINQLIFAAANQATQGRVQLSALEDMLLGSDFDNPNYGGALYHESSLRLGKFELKAGLRFEHEYTRLDYHSYGALKYKARISMPQMPFPIEQESETAIDESGSYRHNYSEWLPKFALIYRFDEQRNLYASISRGFKAGGFNTQLFSDLLKEKLQAKAQGNEYTMGDIVSYKPEYSWNYEIGGHFACAEGVIRGDMALFWIDCEDQQMTIMPDENSTGRMMTNAGRTRSIGGEAALQIRPTEQLALDLAYGYTEATFRNYTSGGVDYRDNYVPYVPRHTLSAGITWTLPTGVRWLGDLVLYGGLSNTGKIYWTEANDQKQGAYTLFNASVRLEHARYTLDLWGRNIGDKSYDLFYFESIGDRFVQSGRPQMFGVTLSINIL